LRKATKKPIIYLSATCFKKVIEDLVHTEKLFKDDPQFLQGWAKRFGLFVVPINPSREKENTKS
jgi:hypothetical protein